MKAAASALSGVPATTNVFLWWHLEYTVAMSDGGERRLLDDVSGYVTPRKLTALMGESGAGKVHAVSSAWEVTAGLKEESVLQTTLLNIEHARGAEDCGCLEG